MGGFQGAVLGGSYCGQKGAVLRGDLCDLKGQFWVVLSVVKKGQF